MKSIDVCWPSGEHRKLTITVDGVPIVLNEEETDQLKSILTDALDKFYYLRHGGL